MILKLKVPTLDFEIKQSGLLVYNTKASQKFNSSKVLIQGKLIAVFVYSAYILKPVLYGRNL